MQVSYSSYIILFLIISTKIFSQDQLSAERLVKLSLEELLNLEVTIASKSLEQQSNAPGIISVLSKDEIKRFGGTTLRDILERVPSLISSGANYSNRTTIAVRGDQVRQNSGHVLFLINGRPVREIQEGGVSSELLESFPTNIIENIEVIKGPGSVLYGSDAFSGVINIKTIPVKETGLSVSGLWETKGGNKFSGSTSLQTEDLTFLAAINYFEKPEWNTELKYPATIEIETPPFTETVIDTAKLNIPNKGFGTYFELQYKNLSFMSSYNYWKTLFVVATLNNLVETKKFFNNLGYTIKVSPGWDMDFNLTYVNSKLQGNTLSKRNSGNLVAEWTNSIKINDNSKLVAGGLYNNAQGEETSLYAKIPAIPIGSVVSKGNLDSYAVYSQIDYTFLQDFKLIGGFQGVKVENIDFKFLPRLGLIWHPTSCLSIKALYSQAFRAPSINEVNMNFGNLLQGNSNLKSESVSTYDLSITFEDEQWEGSVSFFISKMTDIIQDVSTYYENNQDITFTGIEFESKIYFNRELYLAASVLYQNNETTNGDWISPISDLGLKTGISYMSSNNGITVSLFNIYQGNLDNSFIGIYNNNQGAYNLLHLNCVLQLNTIFNLSMNHNLDLLISVDNLLDREHFGYSLGLETTDAIPSIPGRSIQMGLNFSL